MSKPLDGVKVLDFTHTLGGFFSTLILADFGAQVLKVEPPGGNVLRSDPPLVRGESAYFMALNRNKRSLVLDLKHAQGRQIALRLADEADVVVNNFRSGVLEGLGLGYAALRGRNPRIIYAQMTGYGTQGEYKDRGAQEAQIQAISGVMSLTGDPNGPPQMCGINVADLTAGSTLTQGVLAALFARERSGEGQLIEVAMLDSLMFLLCGYYGPSYLADGREHPRRGVRAPFIAPYGAFEASDGSFVLVGRTQQQFAELCRVVGRQAWITDPRFATAKARIANRVELERALDACFKTNTRAHWIALLNERRVPAAPINSVGEALNDPHIRSRVVIEQGHPLGGSAPGLANPVRFGGAAMPHYGASPRFGEHTRAVLAELGYRAEDIAALEAERVVVASEIPSSGQTAQ